MLLVFCNELACFSCEIEGQVDDAAICAIIAAGKPHCNAGVMRGENYYSFTHLQRKFKGDFTHYPVIYQLFFTRFSRFFSYIFHIFCKIGCEGGLRGKKNEPRCDARRLRAFSFGYYLLRVEVSLHNPSRRTPHSKASRYATMLRRPNRHSNVACHRTAETALLIFKFTIFTESMQEKSDTSLSLVSLYHAISLQR